MTEKKQPTGNSATRLFIDSVLPVLISGQLSVTVNGFPAVSIDCESKTLEIEASGVKQTGFLLARMAPIQGGVKQLLMESESIAKRLAQEGWTLTVYDKGSKALAMGSRVSRLTGHIHVNPLKLKGLFSASA